MHLLGTSVVAFILLPLAFSCESTKPKEQISQDYEHVIKRQLEHINSDIKNSDIKLKSCNLGRKRRNATLGGNAFAIHTVSCYRMPKNLNLPQEPDLRKLVREINASLGCQCTPQQEGQKGMDVSKLSPHRKLCKVKQFLAKIQIVYEQYNSAP